MGVSKLNTKDALGNEIIFGEVYGWSSDKNGFTKVTIGKAKNFTSSGMCTFATIKSTKGLWKNEAEDIVAKANVSVKPMKLFPVDVDKLNL